MKKDLLFIFVIFLVVAVFLALLYFLEAASRDEEPESGVKQKNDKKIQAEMDKVEDSGHEKSELEDRSAALGFDIPEDFAMDLYASDLGKVRDILLASDGIIVSSMDEGRVVYLPDDDNNYQADEQVSLLEGVNNPHGLAEYCRNDGECYFYVAATDAVWRYKYNKEAVTLGSGEAILELPDDGGHYTRHLLVSRVNGVDKLLVTVGSKCNVCYEEDWRRAKILYSDLDGGNPQVFASGLRNSVFMTENPFTQEVWATEMGRDWLGDDLPPEEVNIIKQGNDYGWPICYGQNIHDNQFDENTYIRDPCEDKTAPTIMMQAHVAPLGLSFFSLAWVEEYRGDLLVAQHGSWNRTIPVGYKIVRILLDEDYNFLGEEDFVAGFQEEGKRGRPADVLILDNGSIYFSDDNEGKIYIMRYKAN